MKTLIYKVNKKISMEYRIRINITSVISECGMLIRRVVKFSARNCPGINFTKVGNYAFMSRAVNVQAHVTFPAD